VKVGGSERTRLKMDVIWVALLYALGVVFLFRVMKRDRTVPDVVYEGLSVIAALLIVIAVLLYYIYEKL
jgi:Na+/H+ antiporter NhaC